MIGVRLGHFGPVSLYKFLPLSRRLGSLCQFHRDEARRQDGKPDVVPIPGCEVCFGNTTRRTTHSSDTNTFSFDAGGSKPNDTDSQGCLLTYGA